MIKLIFSQNCAVKLFITLHTISFSKISIFQTKIFDEINLLLIIIYSFIKFKHWACNWSQWNRANRFIGRGGRDTTPSPPGPISFIFMQFSVKCCQILGFWVNSGVGARVWKILDPPRGADITTRFHWDENIYIVQWRIQDFVEMGPTYYSAFFLPKIAWKWKRLKGELAPLP